VRRGILGEQEGDLRPPLLPGVDWSTCALM
jgi:hypothetical protein